MCVQSSIRITNYLQHNHSFVYAVLIRTTNYILNNIIYVCKQYSGDPGGLVV